MGGVNSRPGPSMPSIPRAVKTTIFLYDISITSLIRGVQMVGTSNNPSKFKGPKFAGNHIRINRSCRLNIQSSHGSRKTVKSVKLPQSYKVLNRFWNAFVGPSFFLQARPAAEKVISHYEEVDFVGIFLLGVWAPSPKRPKKRVPSTRWFRISVTQTWTEIQEWSWFSPFLGNQSWVTNGRSWFRTCLFLEKG